MFKFAFSSKISIEEFVLQPKRLSRSFSTFVLR